MTRLERPLAPALALCLFCGCDEAAPALDELPSVAPRMGGTKQTVRLVTANLEHVTWENALARTEIDDALILAWMQVLYLETLEGSGPTIFSMQESSERYFRTGGALWPTVLHLSLGASASSPEYADYNSWFQPILASDGEGWGNAIATNLNVEDYEAWNLNAAWDPSDAWDPGEVSNPNATCGGTNQRGAQVLRTEVGGVDIWNVNVHLQYCEDGAFAVNACNLERLLARLETLPSDDVVIVSGDFNIRQDAAGSCPGELQPVRFDEMVRGLPRTAVSPGCDGRRRPCIPPRPELRTHGPPHPGVRAQLRGGPDLRDERPRLHRDGDRRGWPGDVPGDAADVHHVELTTVVIRPRRPLGS
ncbi:MAG: endonuclease/exonuclease/phosphatase family protein [Nannocystales bacterium]